MEGMEPSRPMTHDLFKNTLSGFNIEIKEVVINNLVDGIFYANLICINNGQQTEVDSRTSDALALAVRFGCPIYTYEFILEQAGIILEEETEKEVQKAKSRRSEKKEKVKSLQENSFEELEKLLKVALDTEDYERAAKIRDEINNRQS